MDLKQIIDQMHHYEKVMHGEMDKLWYYDQHDRLPEPKKEVLYAPSDLGDLTIIELITLKGNNRSYISNAKKKNWPQEEIERRRKENEHIDNMLKSLGTYNEITHASPKER